MQHWVLNAYIEFSEKLWKGWKCWRNNATLNSNAYIKKKLKSWEKAKKSDTTMQNWFPHTHILQKRNLISLLIWINIALQQCNRNLWSSQVDFGFEKTYTRYEDFEGRKADWSVQEGTKDLGSRECKHQTFLNWNDSEAEGNKYKVLIDAMETWLILKRWHQWHVPEEEELLL